VHQRVKSRQIKTDISVDISRQETYALLLRVHVAHVASECRECD